MDFRLAIAPSDQGGDGVGEFGLLSPSISFYLLAQLPLPLLTVRLDGSLMKWTSFQYVTLGTKKQVVNTVALSLTICSVQ